MSQHPHDVGAGGALLPEAPPAPSVLVVDDDEMVLALVDRALSGAGFSVTVAGSAVEALERLSEAPPDVVISDVNMPSVDGFALGRQLRADPYLRTVPLLYLSSRDSTADVVQGMELGADDYIAKPFAIEELVARVQAKVQRRPVPADLLSHDPSTGLLTEGRVRERLDREVDRARRTGRPGAVGVFEVAEAARLRDRLGARTLQVLARQLATVLSQDAGPLDEIGRVGAQLVVLLPETDEARVYRRLTAVASRVVATGFPVGGHTLRLTPVIGYATFDGTAPADLLARARLAAEAAGLHLDLRPQRWTPQLQERVPRHRRPAPLLQRLRTPLQIAMTLVLGMVLPFFVYWGFAAAGWDISGAAYVFVAVALLITTASIWLEGLLALTPLQPPARSTQEHPPASAIIAAYLPNEAATLMETVEAFLRIDYPASLQVILAYNTPRDMPIEAALREVAARDRRFLPIRVAASTSKAQNVNAALAEVTGEFVGVFDADHLPDPDSFRRAWRWLSNGYDVVQGHAVVRNGAESGVARLVAVEFESIYAVSHPGRAKLHDFGIFGGSNGYWRTDLLRATRMRGSMLTEDIDSSMRATAEGHRIANDPLLVSRELAPTTWRALWNQRMRWAQGWFQVSKRHLRPVTQSTHLSIRQKAGALFLLGWREVYPWISLQIFPIIAYKAYAAGGVTRLNWLIPIFVLTTLFILGVGPGQVLFAYLNAHPSVKRHRRWFWIYLLATTFYFTELKNLIARVAQIKELMGERAWKVTPRSGAGATASSLTRAAVGSADAGAGKDAP